MMVVPQQAQIERLTLEKLRFAARTHVAYEFFTDVDIEVVASRLADGFEVNLRGFTWSNQIHCETRGTRVPRTWWDHFKQSFFPDWLKERMPVRTNPIRMETKYIHTCPHLPIQSRDEMKMHLQWMIPPEVQYGSIASD